ncbi:MULTISPECIES: CAP domain-containing protein [unclassified Luteococcus]|uniref:CAP domain-containing protein n=1 Tax=unclassified Luteococcus TaxID=2639923 RepID=UPI00313CB242
MTINPRRTTARRAGLAAVAIAPLLAALTGPGLAQAALPANPTVDNSTRAGALAAYRSYNEAATAVAGGWTGNVSSCTPGTVSADAQAATLATINYYRSMVGLAPASFNAAWSAKAQQAALMMEANNSLSHNPPNTWKCWTSDGAGAAATGNLALGFSNGAKAINGYIDDAGNDTTLGHRRWILDPRITTMGSGFTARGNSLKLWEGSVPATNPANTPAFVSWPDAGYVPKVLVPKNNIWTVSASDASTDMSSATVSITSDGKAVPVEVTRPTAGYGKPAVGFKPGISAADVTSDKTLVITVSGMKKGGVEQPAYTYRTTLFDQTQDKSPQTLAWTPAGDGLTGKTATMMATSTSGLPVTYSSSTPTVCTVSGATVSYLAEGSCTITAKQAGDATWAATSESRTILVGQAGKASNVITWAQPAAVDSGTSGTLGATASSGLAVSYASGTPSVCTVSGTTVKYLSGGTCTVTASQSGSATVNAAAPVTRSWAVSGLKANAITWNVPTSVTVGQSVPLNPTSTSGSGAFSYSASMNAVGVCKFGAGTMVFGAKGTCTVTVKQAATATHEAATLSKTFTVS